MNLTPKRKQLIEWALFYLGLLLICFAIVSTDVLNNSLNRLISVTQSVIIGLIFAYLCNPILRLFEERIFRRVKSKGVRRTVSLIFTYLLLLVILALAVILVLPEFIESFSNPETGLANRYADYIRNGVDAINSGIERVRNAVAQFGVEIRLLDANKVIEAVNRFLLDFKIGELTLMDFVTASTPAALFGTIGSAAGVFANILLGLFISIYILASKEKRYAQIMRMRAALFSERFNTVLTEICKTAEMAFGRFFSKKLLDSVVIGTILSIGFSIFDFPYAAMLAVTVAIINILPIVGPFIGFAFSTVFLLLVAPEKVWIFSILFLVAHGLTRKLISARVFGMSAQVTSLCAVIAISTAGRLFGMSGIILGVPLFATGLTLLDSYTKYRLEKKGLPTEAQNYSVNVSDSSLIQPILGKEKSGWIFNRRRSRYGELTPDGGTGNVTVREQQLIDACVLAHGYQLFRNPTEEGLATFAEGLETIRSAPLISTQTPTEPTPTEEPEVPVAEPEEAAPTTEDATPAETAENAAPSDKTHENQ